MSPSLPDRPSLDQLKKQAYERHEAAKTQGRAISLADAYHELAQQYGFASWPKLKHHVETQQVPADYREVIERGDVQRVQHYLQERPELANARLIDPDRPRGQVLAHPAALHVAISAAQKDVALLLIEHGADVNTMCRGRSPVHWAIEHCHGLVEPLLEHGAQLDFAAAANLGRLDLIEQMLERDPALATANPTGSPPLEWAAWGGQMPVAKLLLERGVRPDDVPTAFDAAIRMNHDGILKLLLERSQNPAGQVNKCRLLHTAAGVANTHDNVATVKFLLDQGANPLARDEQGRTPLDLARELRATPRDPSGHTDAQTVAMWLDGVIAVLKTAEATRR